MIGSGAVLFQAGAGNEAGVMADLSLDGTILSGGKGRSTVYRWGAVGAEVQAGRIPGAGGWIE